MVRLSPEYEATIKRCRPLKRDEEEDLNRELVRVRAELAERPDDAELQAELLKIRERFIFGAVRFAVGYSVKRRFALCPEDACQEAIMGLFRAFETYDPTRGVRFYVYARWWMRATLSPAAQRSRCPVAVPRVVGAMLQKADRGASLTSREQKAVTVMRARVTDLDVAESSPAMATGPGAVEDAVAARRAAVRLRRAMRRLDDRTREIVARRWGLDGREEETLQSIATSFGLSRERIRQIILKGQRRLGEALAQ